MPLAGGIEVRKYEWLRSARILMLDVLNPPVYPDLELDAERLVSVMERLSADTVRLPAVFAYAYYRSETVPHHPQLGQRDVIAEVASACHAKGFRVIPYFPALQAKANLLKLWGHETDWPALHKDGTPILLPHGTGIANSDITVLCPRSGAREAARAYVREVVTNYDVDAVYFDGPVTVIGACPDGFCHCSRCREAFEAEEGTAPPESKRYDWSDPLSIRHCLWQRRDGVNMLAELCQTVKGVKDIPFLFNWLDHAAGRRSRGPEMVRFGEGFLVESGEDFTNKVYASKLGQSMERAVFNYIGNYNPWSRYRPGNAEIFLEGCSVIAAGGTPIVASGASCYYNPDESDVVRDLFIHMKKHEEAFRDADQVKFIALPYSQHSADWHIRRKQAEERDFQGNAAGSRYEPYHQGMSKVLLHSHLQFSPIPPWALSDEESLSRYPIMILSNTACMADNEVEAVRQYVAAGGNLLATYETSLYDEYGGRRDDFALADVFGVRFRGQDSVLFEKYLKAGRSSAIPFPDYLVPAVEFNVVEIIDEAETVAETVDGRTPVGPGIVCRKYGKGKVVYVASGIERMYQDGGACSMSPRVTDILTVFSNIVNWLSEGRHPYSIQANRGVYANLTANSDSCFLHLINYNMPNLERPHSQLDDPVPVGNIGCRVTVPEGAEVREVSARVSGERLPFSREGDSVCFQVPQLVSAEIVELMLGGQVHEGD